MQTPESYDRTLRTQRALAFGALGFALAWAASRPGLAIGAVALLVFAVQIELMQALFTSTRVMSRWDVAASVLGGMAGLMIGWRAWRIARLWLVGVRPRA